MNFCTALTKSKRTQCSFFLIITSFVFVLLLSAVLITWQSTVFVQYYLPSWQLAWEPVSQSAHLSIFPFSSSTFDKTKCKQGLPLLPCTHPCQLPFYINFCICSSVNWIFFILCEKHFLKLIK